MVLAINNSIGNCVYILYRSLQILVALRQRNAQARHRTHLVWHIHRAGGGNGADHATSGVQSFCVVGNDRARNYLHRPRRDALLLADGAGGAAGLFLPRHHYVAETFGIPRSAEMATSMFNKMVVALGARRGQPLA